MSILKLLYIKYMNLTEKIKEIKQILINRTKEAKKAEILITI